MRARPPSRGTPAGASALPVHRRFVPDRVVREPERPQRLPEGADQRLLYPPPAFRRDRLSTGKVARIERLEEEKKGMADDIRDVYNEAKSQGYDTKTMRAIVRLRKMEKHARDEAEMLLETYKAALGLS